MELNHIDEVKIDYDFVLHSYRLVQAGVTPSTNLDKILGMYKYSKNNDCDEISANMLEYIVSRVFSTKD